MPKGVEPVHVIRAIDYIEERAADLVDLYFEQANVFSGIVGTFGVKALEGQIQPRCSDQG